MKLEFFKSDDYQKKLKKAILDEAIAMIILNTEYNNEASLRQMLRKRAIKNINKK